MLRSPLGMQTLGDVIATWQLALGLDVDVSGEAVALMERDRDLTARVINVVSEGLTNAVRHASTNAVRLAVSVDPEGSCVVVISHPGALSGRPQGLGSATIDGVCESWALRDTQGMVSLTCRLTPRRVAAVAVTDR